MTCAGVGDVEIWPTSGTVNLQLCAPTGAAHFQAATDEVAAFLAATYELVELGEETHESDIEADLDDLLRQA